MDDCNLFFYTRSITNHLQLTHSYDSYHIMISQLSKHLAQMRASESTETFFVSDIYKRDIRRLRQNSIHLQLKKQWFKSYWYVSLLSNPDELRV